MGRYVKDLILNKPDDFVNFIMNDYLQKNQFVMSDWKGEPAYRAGDAMLEGYKFLKWSYQNGALHLEAWLKSAGGREMDLEGFVATVQKKPYKESLEQLFNVLQQNIPQGQVGQPIPVQTVDNSSAAIWAFICGLLSIVSACIIPLIGLILGAVGFSRARMGSGSSKAGMAKAGKILSAIGSVIAVALWVLNIILTVLV
ncbi:MAG: DUF4190 domain-containing protein [Lachnospiraceae bacterium]|nr:DUF4190 domain-containing protein [Lachnospiraceae bacterium]